MTQALFANFIYSRRTEAVFAIGQEALLYLHEDKKKLVTELKEAFSRADISSNMMELATNSLRQTAEFRKSHDEELAKLREELHKERASRNEAWRILEEERRVHKEDLQSRKVALKLAINEEKGLRMATKNRIEALEGELKEAKIELSKTEAELNEARAKIRTTVADFKKSPIFESFVESKRQQWVSDFN